MRSSVRTGRPSGKPPHEEGARIANRYVLLEPLGSGGMGTVHRAYDEATGRTVAFKQLHTESARSRQLLEAMFEREFHTLARLKHPRAIAVYDYGLTPSGPYYTMELLDRGDLHHAAPVPYRQACRYVCDVASLLALLHAHRMVHRDVSPRNVRLTADGRAKLIDFGALHSFGVAREVVGTAPCMAPEAVHGLPLDQRTDLFALGAVAYWALTGQHAYPARRIEELTELWRNTPVPPSQRAADIPVALDGPILSMLSVDPRSRPSSGAAIIDELCAIAELEVDEHDRTIESYLESSALVGRDQELEWMDRRIARCLEGSGGALMIDAPAGVGKSKLLAEYGLRAQLKGMVLTRVDAQASDAPYAAAIALGAQLLTRCGPLARRAAGPYVGVLGQLSSELRAVFAPHELEKLPENPAERRACVQNALEGWFLAVSYETALLLCVDNVQAADDNSAAFLATLAGVAHTRRLIVLTTRRTGAPVVAAGSVQALMRASTLLRLGSLSAAACTELMSCLFGDVPHLPNLARVIHEKSGGNAQQCMHLARLLVRRGLVKYLAGTWVLPLELAEDELPNRVEDLLEAQFASLSSDARALAEVLSIHARPLPVEALLALSELADRAHTHRALDELLTERIISCDQDRYRFEQDALRKALLARTALELRKARDLRAAEVLQTLAGGNLLAQVQVAFHRMRGGDELRGAALMCKVVRRGVEENDPAECAHEVLPALLRAVEICERHGRSRYELGLLLAMTVSQAYYSAEWKIVLKYGERALRTGLEITGLTNAQRLRSFVGRPLALAGSLGLAQLAFSARKLAGLDCGLIEALSEVAAASGATTATLGIVADIPALQRSIALLEPMALLGDHLPGYFYEGAKLCLAMVRGRLAESRERCDRLAVWVKHPKIVASLDALDWKIVYGGLLWGKAMLVTMEFDNDGLALAAEAEALGSRLWRVAAEQIRVMYYLRRGELEQARPYREQMERYAVQGNTVWQVEISLAGGLLAEDVTSADTVGARRHHEQLLRYADAVPALALLARVAEAFYLGLRGPTQAAIEHYERVLPELVVREHYMAEVARYAFADLLNRAGEHARARQLVLEVLALVPPEDMVYVSNHLEGQRQLALAELGLGNSGEAVGIIENLLSAHGGKDQPLLIGLLHKARAEIALSMQDKAGFEGHYEEMQWRFHGTENPALIAQCERLVERAMRQGIRKRDERAASNASVARLSMLPSMGSPPIDLSALRDPDQLLGAILERARATAGFLYGLDATGGLRLVAATAARSPAGELETQLAQQLERARLDAAAERTAPSARGQPRSATTHRPGRTASRSDADDMTEVIDSAETETPVKTQIFDPLTVDIQQGAHRLILLRTARSDGATLCGALILEVDARHFGRLSAAFLEALAEAVLRLPLNEQGSGDR